MKKLIVSSFLLLGMMAFTTTYATAGSDNNTTKCGEGKCGSSTPMKCGAGKCGGDKKEKTTAKCGAGKCGGGK